MTHAAGLALLALALTAGAPEQALLDPGRDPEMEAERRDTPIGWGGLGALGGLGFVLLGGAVAARRGGRDGLARGALAVFGLTAGVAAADGVLRVTQASWAAHVKIRDGCYHDNPRGYFQESRYHDAPENVAWCAGRIQDVWRGCEDPAARPLAADLRVLALGDSFTDGVGVFARDAWPARLEADLAPGAAVVNCGRAAHFATQVAKRYLAHHERHDPDVVVYALVLNDVLPPALPTSGVRRADVSTHIGDREVFRQQILDRPLLGALWRQSAVGRLAVERWVTARIAEDTIAMYQATWADPARPEVAEALDVVDAMSDLAAEHDARFLVAIWPLLVELDAYPFEAAHATLGAELDRRGVAVLDLLPTFRGRDEAGLHVHPTDHHPNEIAHAEAAAAIAAELGRRGWVTAAPAPPPPR